MKIDAIVSDMDDTLFDGNGQLSQLTLEVMAECTRRGIKVIPASGRTHASMYPFMQQLKTNAPYIGGNGSEIIGADHKLLEQLTLSAELAKEICSFLTENGFYAQAYGDDAFYYSHECDVANRYKKSSGMKGVAVGDLVSFLDFPTPKILSVNDPEEVQKLLPIANKHFQGRATFTVSKPFFLEAEPLGASKGEALVRLSKRIGLKPETTMVFGDSLNDLSMLAFTPHSVAMGNARSEVQKAAAYVCQPNTDDGVAKFVQTHVLEEAF